MELNEPNGEIVAPPAELAGPLPRKVKLNSKFFPFLLLFVFAWSAFIAIMIGSEAIQQTRWRTLLRGNSRETVGDVTGFLSYRFEPKSVTYKFTVEGKTYFGKARAPANLAGAWSALRQSGPILVRFLPSNPAINHPAAWEWSVWIWLINLVFMIFLFTLVSVVSVALLRERTLGREGTVVAGTVASCAPNGRSFQVEYEFRTEEGESLKRKCGCANPHQAGARIWVLHLPGSPRRNHCYPLDDFTIVG